MEKEEVKKHLDKMIATQYYKIEGYAVNLQRSEHGGTSPSDLINPTYLALLDSATFTGISKAIESGKLINYFMLSMNNQFKFKYSPYNKAKQVVKFKPGATVLYDTDAFEYDVDDESELLETETESWLRVTKILNDLYESGEFDRKDFELFRMYYMAEEVLSIKDMTREEVNDIRMMSFRRLAKLNGMFYSTVEKKIKKIRLMVIDRLHELE